MSKFRILTLIIFFNTIISYHYLDDDFRYFIFAAIINYIMLIIHCRKNLPLTLFFIYAIIFYAYLIPKFAFNLPIVYYSEFDDIKYYNKSLLIILVYLNSLMFFLKPFKATFKFPTYGSLFKKNYFIVIMNCIILLSIYMFGFSGKNITDNVVYGTENFGEKSVFTEYYIIFLILALVHNKSVIIKYSIIFFSALMMIKCVLYGSRISALLILLTIFTLEFANRFSIKKVIIGAFIGIILMNFLGIVRENRGGSEFSFKSLIRVDPDKIMSSTQSNMFYGSVCFNGLIEKGDFDIRTRIKSFFGFIFRLFIPSKFSFDEGSLTDYGQRYTDWGGGAHPSTYFFVWFGWVGPVFFGWVIAQLMNLLKKLTINKYLMFVSMILIITFPRWYGYEPGIIFKMSWVGITLLIILENLFFKIENNKHLS